jgi:hypothetical protein
MNKILIVYPVGAYGSFIYWMLIAKQYNLSIDNAPFKNSTVGSSHQFTNGEFPMIFSKAHLLEFLDSPNLSVKHMHLNDELTVDLLKECNKIKLVYLNFNRNSKIWVMNNRHFKITKNGFFDNYFFTEFLTKWGIRDFNHYNRWELREALSYFVSQIDSPAESYLKTAITNNSDVDVGMYVDINELRDNFENTLDKIYTYCGIDCNNDFIQQIKPIWLESQHHKFKDKLVNDISTNIINNIDFTITDELSIIDEAYIQYNLRIAGVELRCYNLNTFPKTNKEFQSLIFRNYNTLVENKFNYILDKVYNKQLSNNEALRELELIFKGIE